MVSHIKQKGFTLLELVICLLVVAILYGVLAGRLNRIAESAERAAVYGMLGQVRQQINLRLAKFYIEGSPGKAKDLLHENPFEWISPLPKQYDGEVKETLIEGRWYFDQALNQLVYRVQRNKNLKIEGENQRNLRFVLKLNGRSADNQKNGAVYSITIQAVRPFDWNIGA